LNYETMETKKQNSSHHTGEFYRGIKTAVPIAVGYIPIAITFGLVAKSSGIPDYISVLMSFMVFAGASQFVGVNLIAMGTSPWEIVFTTFILNLRHFLMTASLSLRLEPGVSKAWRSLLAFGITDETFTVASLQEDELLSKYFIIGLNLLAFLAWNAGTWVGIFLGSALSASLQASMGIALYAMFIGLLVPALKNSRSVILVVIIAIGIHSALCWIPVCAGLSTGWKIIISTITAAFAVSCIYPEGVSDND